MRSRQLSRGDRPAARTAACSDRRDLPPLRPPAPPLGDAAEPRRRAIVLVAVALAALSATAACETVSHRDIGDEINILIRRNDQLVPPATKSSINAFCSAAVP